LLVKKLNDDGNYVFYCPGCDDLHVTDNSITFDGDDFAPTFKPSFYDWDSSGVCHIQIQQGRLHYLPDSTHSLVEQTVPMAPLPKWFIDAVDDDELPEYVPASDKYYYTAPPIEDLEDTEDNELSPDYSDPEPDASVA
jgi:hypothetical protein